MKDTDRQLLQETAALHAQMLATLAHLEKVVALVAARAEKTECGEREDQEGAP